MPGSEWIWWSQPWPSPMPMNWCQSFCALLAMECGPMIPAGDFEMVEFAVIGVLNHADSGIEPAGIGPVVLRRIREADVGGGIDLLAEQNLIMLPVPLAAATKRCEGAADIHAKGPWKALSAPTLGDSHVNCAPCV